MRVSNLDRPTLLGLVDGKPGQSDPAQVRSDTFHDPKTAIEMNAAGSFLSQEEHALENECFFNKEQGRSKSSSEVVSNGGIEPDGRRLVYERRGCFLGVRARPQFARAEKGDKKGVEKSRRSQ